MKDVQAVCCVPAQLDRGEAGPSQVGQIEHMSFLTSAGPASSFKLGREAEESRASQGHSS